MDALTLMKADHEQLKRLLDEALDTTDARKRADLMHQIRAQLVAHERMEEDVFYPALRGHPKAKEIVLEGYEEHHVIDLILDELLDVPEESDAWKAKLKVLQENVEHHIEEEEGEMFDKARRAFDEDELAQLGLQMQAMKDASVA